MQEVVIKIPNEIYQDVIKNGFIYDEDGEVISHAIINGTVLPKGHGRLGDLDNIWSELKELEEHYQAEFLKKSNAIHESAMCGRYFGFTASKFIVQDAPTIIESDRSEE